MIHFLLGFFIGIEIASILILLMLTKIYKEDNT